MADPFQDTKAVLAGCAAQRFQHTREALAAFDAQREAREKVWDEARTHGDVRKAALVDLRAALAVSAAFFKDTSDVNNWDQAKLVHPDDPWLRELVK